MSASQPVIPISSHWADQAAAKVVRERGDKPLYTVASGITPSGVVHIGNFREVITVDFVARALQRLQRQVRFIYSWDDFDTFRKVPLNLPKQEEMKAYLRQPISRIPDPWGEHGSYAEHNIKQFEKNLPTMGIAPEFLYQQQRYGAGLYAQNIRLALEAKDKIKAILDRYRTEPLADSWVPTSIYCEACQRDEMEYERYTGEWGYAYKCRSCQHEAVTDIRTTKNLKLAWRVDWPMRWNFEGVDFEPGGKDHSSEGGSFDTGKPIVAEIFGGLAPNYVQYDFVSIKGGPGKMSSSSGNAVDLETVLEIYSPEMIRWIFARQKPNTDFSISFDEDVIKAHDEFDRLEEQVYKELANTDGKSVLNRRIYELSLPENSIPAQRPFRAGFRVLANRLQICGGDVQRTMSRFYAEEVRTPADRQAFESRARRAWSWLAKYAPEEFRYALNDQPSSFPLSTEQATALKALCNLLAKLDLTSIDPKDLNQQIYDEAIHGTGADPKAVFQAVYQRLINRDQGPRLPGFLKEIGKEKALELL